MAGKLTNPQAVFEIQATLCRSMGNPIRLAILYRLRDGPKCVNELSLLLEQPPSTISHHLSIMRSAGIVLPDHKAQNTYYRVANPTLLRICELMQEALEEQRVHETRLARDFESDLLHRG